MYEIMLSRFKSASPKLKFFLGLWIALEIISIPAAAGFAWAFGWPSLSQASESQLVAERLETDIPGTSHFVVTHSSDFDITVSGTVHEVQVKVEDAHNEIATVSACAKMVSQAPRVIKTVTAPALADRPIGTLFVTVTHDLDVIPDIQFARYADAPQALPCQIS